MAVENEETHLHIGAIVFPRIDQTDFTGRFGDAAAQAIQLSLAEADWYTNPSSDREPVKI